MGVEPTSKAWEAFILPMNYIRKLLKHYTTVFHRWQDFFMRPPLTAFVKTKC